MKSKWLLYGAVFVCAAVVGLPQWYSLAKPGKKPRKDISNEPTREELEAMGGSLELGGMPQVPDPGAPRSDLSSRGSGPLGVPGQSPSKFPVAQQSSGVPANGNKTELVDDLVSTLQRLQAIEAPSSRPDLERFSSLWVVTEPEPSDSTPGLQDAGPREVIEAASEATWEEVSAAFPVRGILRDKEQALALVGDFVVRVGDQLLPAGELVLTSIEARGLVLDFRGAEVRLELPPFRPRARTGSELAGSGAAEGPLDTGMSPADSVDSTLNGPMQAAPASQNN